jgi:hypothetical protein
VPRRDLKQIPEEEFMTSSKKLSRIHVLLLSLISSVAFPSHAGAQPVIAGRFTLTSEVKWGTMVLPAGDYSYALEDTVSPSPVTIYAADGSGKGMVLPTYASDGKESGRNKISLETKNGQAVVSALYVEKLGLVLHFDTGKTNAELAKKTAPDPKLNSYLQAK